MANFWGRQSERGIIGPQTPTRASSQTVPGASAQLLARPSLPSALEMGSGEGGEEKGVGKTQGQNDSGTSREEKKARWDAGARVLHPGLQP